MTQEEFAEKIGISIQGLSNLERNRYQPTSDTIDKICKNFKISPVELLLTNSKTNETLIKNINALLQNCSDQNDNRQVRQQFFPDDCIGIASKDVKRRSK